MSDRGIRSRGGTYASGRLVSVLIVNPNAEVVVLPGCTLIGKLVPVVAISVAMEDTGLPNDGPATLLEYLEEIVGGSHPSLGDAGRQLLQDLIFRYRHVFLAPGEPVTGQPRQFNMISLRRTPGQFAAAHDGWLRPEKNRHVCRKCCTGDKLSLLIALGRPPLF